MNEHKGHVLKPLGRLPEPELFPMTHTPEIVIEITRAFTVRVGYREMACEAEWAPRAEIVS